MDVSVQISTAYGAGYCVCTVVVVGETDGGAGIPVPAVPLGVDRLR